MKFDSDVLDLKEKCESHYSKNDSVAHQWLHIRKVAEGAAFFVRMTGGTHREEQIAYVSGLLHDYTREREEKPHNITSAEDARKILRDYASFSEEDINDICCAIIDHRRLAEWRNKVHQSVYLADHIFEHMGAYLLFRGAAWIGETGETYAGKDPIEKMINYYDAVKARVFLDSNYPMFTRPLLDYQNKWNYELMDALNKRYGWITDMVLSIYDVGKNSGNLEKAILRFEPKGQTQETWSNEAKSYVRGEKLKEFEKLFC